MLKTNDWYESYETQFLFMFCSFRFGLMCAFYGTSKLLLALHFCRTLLVIVQVNRSMRNIKQYHLFDI